MLICLAALLLAAPAAAETGQLGDIPAYEYIENAVAQIVANDFQRLFGEEPTPACLSTRELALCLEPGTPQDEIDAILRRLPTWQDEDDRFMPGPRWATTATDGSTGAWGDPITLTYSFIPDGTYIPPGAGEPGSPSELYAEMNSHFGDPSVWKPFFAEHFESWGQHIGISYVEVEDDGASFPNSPGILGARGDVRIGAHYIGGVILAYNYFPPGGDMVLDTADNWGNSASDYRFFRNIVAHEHGHGHGLNHETPLSCTKLMEANLCMNFTYPQDDDIRGGMNSYGDFLENDDDAGEANELGAFTGEMIIATPSLDHDYDTDWFHFVVTATSLLDVTVHPVGSAYQIHGVVVFTHKMQDLSFELRDGVDGSNIILTVDDTIEGVDEILLDYTLSPGEYWIRVDGVQTGTGLVVQRYDITLDITLDDLTSAPDHGQPLAGLGLGVYPNPFNPKTTAHFYAPAAGPVSLDVYNVAGGLVRSIETRVESAGWMEIVWDGQDEQGQNIPSGIYFLRAQAGALSETVRGVLLK